LLSFDAASAVRARIAADPTSILDVDQVDELVAAGSQLATEFAPQRPVTVEFVISWADLHAALQAALDQAIAAIEAVVTAVVVGPIADVIATLDDTPALNRKRHGRAAICPRHGPTTGGLCKRCVRR
jgi:hypothetical protein